jgi:hypothetical protein
MRQQAKSSPSFDHGMCDEFRLARPFLKRSSLHGRCHFQRSVWSVERATRRFIDSGSCFHFAVFCWRGLRHGRPIRFTLVVRVEAGTHTLHIDALEA